MSDENSIDYSARHWWARKEAEDLITGFLDRWVIVETPTGPAEGLLRSIHVSKYGEFYELALQRHSSVLLVNEWSVIKTLSLPRTEGHGQTPSNSTFLSKE